MRNSRFRDQGSARRFRFIDDVEAKLQTRSLAWLRQGLARSTAVLVLGLCLLAATLMALVARQVLDSALRANLETDLNREFDRAQTGLTLWRAQEAEDVAEIAADAVLTRELERGVAGANAARARLATLLGRESEALGLAVLTARSGVDVCASTWLPDHWHEAVDQRASVLRGSSEISMIEDTVVDLIRVPLKLTGDHAVLLAATNPLLAPDLVAEGSDANMALIDERGEVLLGSPAAVELAPRAGLSEAVNREGREFFALRKNIANTPWQLVIARPITPVPASTILNVVLASLLVAGAAGAAAFFVGVWRLRPLLELADGARRLAAGDFAVRVSVNDQDDEVRILACSFNEMAGQLEAQQIALEERHQDLLRANEVLEQLSITDGLTHLHNHRHFHDQFAREVKRFERSRQPLCLMLIDVDDFKLLNDRYGHAAGDRVLAVAAQLMNGQVRESDYLARYGGEEFAMLLPQTPLQGAIALAEKIRTVLSQHSFALPESEQRVRVTVSVGVAEHAATADETFDAADRALYEAKGAGKDCVVAAQPQSHTPPSERRRR
jgi:diguanylate cyclase (GGDEF)-like protein